MRWIVGVDTRQRCQGALRFCEWIADESRRAADDRFEAVHVLQDEDLRPLQSHASLSEIERMARERFGQVLADSRLREVLASHDIVFETTAERALTKRVGEGPAGSARPVLLVGRRAPRGSTGWTRLGRTARRLVRHLPAPVVVVPPDFDPSSAHAGPVVLATNLGPDADGAAELAAQLARQWKRPLLAATVLPGIVDEPPAYLPVAAHQQVVAGRQEQTRRDLELWLRRHELSGTEVVVLSGDPVDRLTTLAFERDAVMVVVGSRLLTLRSRIFSSSIGSDLAGSATVPVAVVPPPIA